MKEKLLEEIRKAQDNCMNQDWHRIELNKLWYDYNPFSRQLYNITTTN